MIEGWKIREWREQAQMTTQELADAASMRRAYLEDIEADRVTRVHTRTYLKLADALGLSLDQLASDPETPSTVALLSDVPSSQRILFSGLLQLVVILGTVTLVFGLILLLSYILWLSVHWGILPPLEEALGTLKLIR